MPVWLEVVLVIVCIGLACYAWGLRMDLKRTEGFLEMSRSQTERLSKKLKAANQQIADLKARNGEANTKKPKEPSFLSADDPMDEILRSVGRLDR